MTHKNNLSQALKEKGISKAELARRIGILPQSLSKYFAGTRTPSDGMLEKMEAALGMEVTVITKFSDVNTSTT